MSQAYRSGESLSLHPINATTTPDTPHFEDAHLGEDVHRTIRLEAVKSPSGSTLLVKDKNKVEIFSGSADTLTSVITNVTYISVVTPLYITCSVNTGKVYFFGEFV